MSGAVARTERRPVRPVSLALLLAVAIVLGFLSGFPAGLGVFLAVGLVVVGAVLRAVPGHGLAAYAPVPVLGVLLLEASTAPVGFGTELFAGLAGLAFLVWLADDPARPAGGSVRALPALAVPALALALAWSSALFLPTGLLPVGVAGALLALLVAAVALLAGRPTVFDREAARS